MAAATRAKKQLKLDRTKNEVIGYRTNYVSHTMVKLTKSQKIAMQWRKIYDLPPLDTKPRHDAVKDLYGMLKEYADHEDPVEFVKQIRENIY
jgi:hypothetical protein